MDDRIISCIRRLQTLRSAYEKLKGIVKSKSDDPEKSVLCEGAVIGIDKALEIIKQEYNVED
jgi:hypothetical protein